MSNDTTPTLPPPSHAPFDDNVDRTPRITPPQSNWSVLVVFTIIGVLGIGVGFFWGTASGSNREFRDTAVVNDWNNEWIQERLIDVDVKLDDLVEEAASIHYDDPEFTQGLDDGTIAAIEEILSGPESLTNQRVTKTNPGKSEAYTEGYRIGYDLMMSTISSIDIEPTGASHNDDIVLDYQSGCTAGFEAGVTAAAEGQHMDEDVRLGLGFIPYLDVNSYTTGFNTCYTSAYFGQFELRMSPYSTNYTHCHTMAAHDFLDGIEYANPLDSINQDATEAARGCFNGYNDGWFEINASGAIPEASFDTTVYDDPVYTESYASCEEDGLADGPDQNWSPPPAESEMGDPDPAALGCYDGYFSGYNNSLPEGIPPMNK